MKVGILGGSGLIGKFLSLELAKRGDDIYIFSRQNKLPPKLNNVPGIYLITSKEPIESNLDGLDVVINLVGEPIVGSRWNESQKKAIQTSRTDFTKMLVEKLSYTNKKPKVLINGSAIGYYGLFEDGKVVNKEDSPPDPQDFLSNLCIEWENAALEAQKMGIRVVLIRTGIVLSTEGGALKQMLPAFQFFMGGPIASGKQYTSWIHINDMVNAILFLIDNQSCAGAYNITAPNPVSNETFSGILAKTLSRTNFFRVPKIALELIFGEGSIILIQGQNVVPQKLLDAGFQFQYNHLKDALKNLLKHL
ncbi:MAG: TIGR01777 family protein [Leptospiraceae bacterium]|nr:TIGR01777 family oxidoreductase [Leptospiraceae bacterium]MCP5493117.1 TIGR01777 family protein [Leptospiraceae bacterium]